VLFDFILWADGGDILIDCEGSQADALRKRLLLYRLRRPIRIEREEDLAVHWSPRAPAEAGAQAGSGAGLLLSQEHVHDPRLPELGHRWLGPPGEPAQGWLPHRLSLGVAEGAAELGQDKILWLECNAAELGGVSFTKGCYVGQENTARMNYRSKVNRRLVVVPTDTPGERARIHYPELGLAVEHRRVDALGDPLLPSWLRRALEAA
jgi:folate-binding protein YgfZ